MAAQLFAMAVIASTCSTATIASMPKLSTKNARVLLIICLFFLLYGKSLKNGL